MKCEADLLIGLGMLAKHDFAFISGGAPAGGAAVLRRRGSHRAARASPATARASGLYGHGRRARRRKKRVDPAACQE
jgi:hypothetical protein